MAESTFQNPKAQFQKIMDERRLRNSMPSKHPKINTTFDKIKYDHNSPILGVAIGMKEEQTVILADKFKKAEEEAKASSPVNWPSRMLEILMPTLTAEELVFCTSYIIGQKVRGII